MGFIIALVFFLIVAAAVVVPIVLVYSRRQAREQKNYERGLKMIPLLIHLPPISEDTEANGRDVRDLMEENISKAQVIYNIIASTYEKGFKRKLYGQQHFAFEILSAQGFVYFYATVPIGLVEVVRQAVTSAYPAARLEEAEEHNIFNNAGKAAATTGGELVLRESFAYPISTYLDLKRDGMQAMLNSLADLGKEDGAAIQILLRPADPGWRKAAHDVASSKRKGEDGSGGAGTKVFNGLKEVGTAFVKPPEAGSGGGSDKPELSENEQQILNSIDEKTRFPAYEVLIRLVASSNLTQTSQKIMNSMVASFSQFDAPSKNGFKFEPAKDIDELVTAYILKFFPQDNNKMILNSVELASIFHFPDQRSIPTTQLERQDSKQTDGPRNMPDEGLLLGYNVFRGVKKPIRLGIGDRQRHMYVVGQTGTGKSTFLENLALQDMLSGNGFAFVDPHGDTAEKLLSMVPRERTEDVIYFSPADMDHPMGLNLFEYQSVEQKDFLVQEVLNMLYKLYDPQRQGIMGPRYEDMFRNAALAVMADPAGGTFIEIPQLFRDPQFLKQKLAHVKDQTVLDFWQKQFPASQRSNEAGEVTAWFVSKFGAFLSNEMMRNIIGQTKSSFDLRDIMDNKKILLVNLSKGRTGDLNSKLLGMIFVMKFQAAAMSRANIPEKERVDFSLYVDEFQNFSTDSFATIMSEARKYHLNLIVANQFTTQLTEEIRDAVFGNMGTIVAFRVGQNDVDALARYFQPTFDTDDLLRVPNYNTITRTLVGGVPTQPFSMSTLPPLGEPNEKLSAALKQLSAAKFGKPRAEVEKDIFKRMAVPAAAPGMAGGAGALGASNAPGSAGARPFNNMGGMNGAGNMSATAAPGGGFGASPFGGQARSGGFAAAPAGAGGMGGAPAPRPGTGSFLDEWMAKRGSGNGIGNGSMAGASPVGPNMAGTPSVVGTPGQVVGPGTPAGPGFGGPSGPAPSPYNSYSNSNAGAPFGPAPYRALNQNPYAPKLPPQIQPDGSPMTPDMPLSAPASFPAQPPQPMPPSQPIMPTAPAAATYQPSSLGPQQPDVNRLGDLDKTTHYGGNASNGNNNENRGGESGDNGGNGGSQQAPSMISRHNHAMTAAAGSKDGADAENAAGPDISTKKKKRKKKSKSGNKSPSEARGGSTSSLDAGGGPSFGQGKLPNAEIDEDTPSEDESYIAGPSGMGPADEDGDDESDNGSATGDGEKLAAPSEKHLQHKGLTLQPLSGADKRPSLFQPQPEQFAPPTSPAPAPTFAQTGQPYEQPETEQQSEPALNAPAPLPAPLQPQTHNTEQPDRVPDPVEDHFAHGDTIYIDQNGNLQTTGSDK